MTETEVDESLEQLVSKAKLGCLQSYEQIVLQLQDRVYGFTLQLLRNEHDAQDVAQETFIKAYQNIHSFDSRGRFTTWLYTIARNTAINHMRKRRRTEPIESIQDNLCDATPDSELDERDSIWHLVKKLKPQFQDVLWLYYGEGFTLNEIAQITHRNAISVRVALYRARGALKKKLCSRGQY